MKLTLAQWMEIRDNLDAVVFGSTGFFRSALLSMVTQAEKIYYPEQK